MEHRNLTLFKYFTRLHWAKFDSHFNKSALFHSNFQMSQTHLESKIFTNNYIKRRSFSVEKSKNSKINTTKRFMISTIQGEGLYTSHSWILSLTHLYRAYIDWSPETHMLNGNFHLQDWIPINFTSDCLFNILRNSRDLELKDSGGLKLILNKFKS